MQTQYSEADQERITDLINGMHDRMRELRDVIDDLAHVHVDNLPITPATIEADRIRERDYVNVLRELHGLRRDFTRLCIALDDPDGTHEDHEARQ